MLHSTKKPKSIACVNVKQLRDLQNIFDASQQTNGELFLFILCRKSAFLERKCTIQFNVPQLQILYKYFQQKYFMFIFVLLNFNQTGQN